MASVRMLRVDPSVEVTWEEAYNQFIMFKKAQGSAQKTLDDYIYYIARFFRQFNASLDSRDLKQQVQKFFSADIAAATYNIRLHTLSPFFKWCQREGYIGYNPCEGYKTRKVPYRVVDIDNEVLAGLLKLPDRRTFTGLRDFATICLTLDTGIRPKEAFSLMETDCRLAATPEVIIRAENAKTRTERRLPITATTAKALREIIASRPPEWENSPVLCSFEGTVMNDSSWGDRMQRYSARLGVKIKPYDLRHCFALGFLRNGGNVFALQRMMGHTDLSMTRRYIALAQSDLKEQHDAASPLSRLMSDQKKRVRRIRE